MAEPLLPHNLCSSKALHVWSSAAYTSSREGKLSVVQQFALGVCMYALYCQNHPEDQ